MPKSQGNLRDFVAMADFSAEHVKENDALSWQSLY